MLTRHQISGPTLLLSILGKSAGTVLTGVYQRSIVAIVTDADALLPDGALASAPGASPPRSTLASRHCRAEIGEFLRAEVRVGEHCADLGRVWDENTADGEHTAWWLRRRARCCLAAGVRRVRCSARAEVRVADDGVVAIVGGGAEQAIVLPRGAL